MEEKVATPDEVATLGSEDLPAIYQAANGNSVEAQRKFLRRSGTGLVMAMVAAGAGALVGVQWLNPFERVELAGMVAAAAFAIALLARLYLLAGQPERTWYEGRAAAESAKTLAWRYAVGGKPFGIDQDPNEVDNHLIERLKEILTDLDAESLTMPSGNAKQITDKMHHVRRMSLEERKRAYRVGRIEDQLDWYCRKAQWNKKRSEKWNLCLISIEAVGIIMAVATAVGWPGLNVLGLLGAVVAAGASWTQTKQHSNLMRAYSVAAHEISAINDCIRLHRTEESWAQFVNESEDAISREHTLWRASKTSK